MRSSLVVGLAFAALAFAATPARAQTGGSGGTGGGTGSTGLGSCSGVLGGTVGIALPDSSGNLTAVQPASVPFVFNAPECVCSPTAQNQQVNLEIKLNKAPGPMAGAVLQVWVGSGCDNYMNRTNTSVTPVCEQLMNIPVSATDFTTQSPNLGTAIHIPIPGNALASPHLHMCSASNTTNEIYVFMWLNGINNTTIDGQCTLSLTEEGAGPNPPQRPAATGGDGIAHLTWAATAQPFPYAFQVLCSDDSGNPVMSARPALFSACTNGVLRRRPLTTGNITVPSGGSDGGTASVVEHGGGAEALGHIVSPQAPVTTDMAVGDGGLDGGTTTTSDMAVNPVTFGPLASLDPKYVCTDNLAATSLGTDIKSLKNGTKYHFVVLSIDQYGNATPAPDVSVTPNAVEDFYRRYRDKNGAAGSCFIATAAFGSYENRWVKVLRDLRDETLLPTDLGRRFVGWYYEHSPPAAAWIAERPWARAIVRILLLPVIALSALWLYAPPFVKALIMLAAIAWLLRRRLAAAWRGVGA